MDKKQIERYNRHIILPEIGEEGQQKLLQSKVLVVGAGGLGSPVLQYLTAAGIGRIGIVDNDIISLSNLQRQVLYREYQLDKPKALEAAENLAKLNSDVSFQVYTEKLDDANAERIMQHYDLVIGATDNFKSRKIIDRVSSKLNIPFVNGSISEFEGQVSVFNFKGGPSYTDLFPDFPEESSLPLGVMGVLPGIVGSIQTCEAIKILVGFGEVLSGKLLVFNAKTMNFNIMVLN